MRGDRRFASSSPVALIVLYLFPLFTFYSPPNSGHLNSLYYVQIILAYFFLGSFESNLSLFMYRVYPVTDEHSSCCSQRSTALLFSFAVKSSPRRTCACRKNDRSSILWKVDSAFASPFPLPIPQIKSGLFLWNLDL